MRESITESKWKKVLPVGDSVLIIKEEDEGVSAGGVIIPEAHREYRRRGWVLAVGGGYRARDGSAIRMPYSPGDYIFADREYVRKDESEDEIFSDPSIILIRGNEPVAFIRREDCEGRYKLPKKHLEIVEKYGHKPS
jgi:co-chaperonin GroES (HSP10)